VETGCNQDQPDEPKWPEALSWVDPILTGMALSLRGWTRNLAALVGLWGGVGALPSAADQNPCAPPPPPPGLVAATVRRVVDGDTIVIRLAGQRNERVRLIGVDTPEIDESEKLVRESARTGHDADTLRRAGRRAAAFTSTWLPAGQRVGLELDVGPRDREGRLLVYVWRDDGLLVNLALVEAGQAQLLTIHPNVRHAHRFRACAAAAQAARRGLWASAPGQGR
jgi:micrococcal nuclease